jgi:type IV pilus assembly protein PilA
MKRSIQQGFTLIELMIVVAIVGILAAIALPAYNDYMTRSKVSELVLQLDQAKTTVAEYFASNGSYGSQTSVGLHGTLSGDYAKSVACGTNCGLITVTSSSNTKLPSDARNSTVALSAVSSANGMVRWKCKAGTTGTAMPAKYLPGSCK